MNYVWRQDLAWDRDDELDPSELTERRKALIRGSLSRMAKLSPGDTLIEKTVANALRVPFVDAVFPDARYVHLLRDGRDVTESAIRQWKASPRWRDLLRKVREMPLRNADYVLWYAANTISGLRNGRQGGKVWGPRYAGIDREVPVRPLVEICAEQWKRCVEAATRDLAAIPPGRAFAIRYEDLVSGPEPIRDLAVRLGLDPGPVVSAYHVRLRRDTGRRDGLAPGDAARMDAVIGPTLRRLGYAA